jgi:TRAP-type uncharacterized transport system substrate-binding protein
MTGRRLAAARGGLMEASRLPRAASEFADDGMMERRGFGMAGLSRAVRVGLVGALGLGLAASGANALEATVYAGPEGGYVYDVLGPNMMTALYPEFRLTLERTEGSAENIKMVLANPVGFGFSQRDIYEGYLRDVSGEVTPPLEYYGSLGLRCVYAVVRSGGWIKSFDDIVGAPDGNPITLDIGPAGGETAATFAEMRRRDPSLAGVETENSETSQAISYVDAGRTDVAFFIARPDTGDPYVARVLESDTLEFVPIVSRNILTPSDDGGNVYTYTRITLGGGNWFQAAKTHDTICTTLGIVVNTDGDPELLDALAFVTLSTDLDPAPPGWMERVRTELANARRRAQALFDRLF